MFVNGLKDTNSKQKILKYMQLHYVWVMFLKVFNDSKYFSVDYDSIDVDDVLCI